MDNNPVLSLLARYLFMSSLPLIFLFFKKGIFVFISGFVSLVSSVNIDSD